MTRKAMLLVVGALVLSALVVSQAISQDAGGGAAPGGKGAPGGGRGGPGRGAPGGGNFDPAAMRQAQLDRIKTQLGATDEEWKALSPKVEKVLQAQRDARAGGRSFGGRGGAGGQPAPTTQPQSPVAAANDALNKVLENKDASAEQIKTALTALREAKAKAKAELEKAQKDLRELLTVRQEALLVADGMLD